MITSIDLKQELIDVNLWIEYYTNKEPDEEKLLYWQTIKKYVIDKLMRKLAIENGVNS